MNSSLLPTAKHTTTSAEAGQASTWIERFATPIVISAMEAQPIALVIVLLTEIVGGKIANTPIGSGSITLIALGLLWWAIIVEYIVRRSPMGRRLAWLHVLGWLVALTVIVGPHLPSLFKAQNFFAALVGTVLVTWLWRRSMSRVQAGFEYGQLSVSFRVGFGILLGILLIGIVVPGQQALRDALAGALPIFFLSGLIALSLVRLGIIRNARRALDSSQADPTRAWLLGLTLFGVGLIVLVIAIESIFSFRSFELVVTALGPVWDALGTFAGWIVYGIIVILTPIFDAISFLVGLFKHHAASQQSQPSLAPKKSPFLNQPGGLHGIAPQVIDIARWGVLALALMILLFVVRASIRRWFKMHDNQGVEEVREGLDARSLLGQRWQNWRNRRRRTKHVALSLEPLDSASARAHYRELLQAIANSKSDLAWRAAETPAEYEVRLLEHLGNGSIQGHTDADDVPVDPAILNELTRAYVNERYGGKSSDHRLRAYLQTWVPRLVMHLTGRAPAQARPRRTRS